MKKQTNQIKLFKIFATLNLMLAPIGIHAHAQVGGSNGGDPNELAEFQGKNGEHLQSWYEVKTDLILGLNKNQHTKLDLKGMNPDLFKEKALHALNEAVVEFKDERIFVEGVSRPCKNFVDSYNKLHIQCDILNYPLEMKNYTSEEQYKFVAHEYLGVANLESNSYGLSDYLFSSQISSSLKNVLVKKWMVADDKPEIKVGDLVMEDLPSYYQKMMGTDDFRSIQKVKATANGQYLLEDGSWYGLSNVHPKQQSLNGIQFNDCVMEDTPKATSIDGPPSQPTVQRVRFMSGDLFQLENNRWYSPKNVFKTENEACKNDLSTPSTITDENRPAIGHEFYTTGYSVEFIPTGKNGNYTIKVFIQYPDKFKFSSTGVMKGDVFIYLDPKLGEKCIYRAKRDADKKVIELNLYSEPFKDLCLGKMLKSS